MYKSRSRIDKNFDLQEMRTDIAAFLKNFDILLIEQEMVDSKGNRQFIAMSVAKSSYNVKVKLRQQWPFS
jgi:hypothetical protein